jgi:hypothetical protein
LDIGSWFLDPGSVYLESEILVTAKLKAKTDGIWNWFPHHPSGAFGGGGQLSVLYMSALSQHSLEQKSTGSKHTQIPQKLVW